MWAEGRSKEDNARAFVGENAATCENCRRGRQGQRRKELQQHVERPEDFDPNDPWDDRRSMSMADNEGEKP
jgi:hypothetical protein